MDERIESSEAFGNGSPQRKVVDQKVSDDSPFIDQEEASVGNILILFEDLEALCNLSGGVSNERILDASDAALVFRSFQPGEMGFDRVNGAAYHCSISVFKIGKFVLKSMEFCGADEREIERVEKEDHIFS